MKIDWSNDVLRILGINKLALVFVFLIILNSCSDRNDLVGTYTGNAQNNIDTLILFKSGSFKRNLNRKEDSLLLYTQVGEWKYIASNQILLRDFFIDNDEEYNKDYAFNSVLVDATLEIKFGFSAVRINYSAWEAVDVYYKKVD